MKIETTDLSLISSITNKDFNTVKDMLLFKVEYKHIKKDIEIKKGKYDILVELIEGNISVYATLCYMLGDKKMTALECCLLIDEFTHFITK